MFVAMGKKKTIDKPRYIVATLLTQNLLYENLLTRKEFDVIDEKNRIVFNNDKKHDILNKEK